MKSMIHIFFKPCYSLKVPNASKIQKLKKKCLLQIGPTKSIYLGKQEGRCLNWFSYILIISGRLLCNETGKPFLICKKFIRISIFLEVSYFKTTLMDNKPVCILIIMASFFVQTDFCNEGKIMLLCNTI